MTNKTETTIEEDVENIKEAFRFCGNMSMSYDEQELIKAFERVRRDAFSSGSRFADDTR